MKCVKCGEKFVLRPDHRGKANECLNCGGSDIPKLMAKVSWEGKHFPVIEVCSAKEAVPFNKAQNRFGHGVIRGIVQPKLTDDEKDTARSEGGLESSKPYRDKLGQRRG